jgi:3-isopropylmalate/(R)-2-methylmalate dehydratase small subunit
MKRVQGRFVYLDVQNVDTDRIVPARFLKATTKRGLASALFADWAEGAAARRAIDEGASILVAAENFGCGSSREHAVWALADAGIRAVLSPRLADIFRSNASKNGIVPVVIDDSTYALLRSSLEAEIEVDLDAMTVGVRGGPGTSFSLDPFARRCLREDVDELGFLLSRRGAIAAYEQCKL